MTNREDNGGASDFRLPFPDPDTPPPDPDLQQVFRVRLRR